MASNQYIFPKPSTMATRSLISDDKASDISAKPALQRKTTDHYEQAAAAATKAGSISATTAGSIAASASDRPGAQRTPSWKMSDFKGQQQGQMLAGRVGEQGYSSTTGKQ